MFDKLKLLEPELIMSKEMGHYKAYSRACPSNLMRQPVILTNDEKTQIDKNNRNGYGYALKYGANKENPHWFICPRYWCLETNKPVTKADVDSGVCAGKIHEFTENRFHVDKDGKYVHHSPGFCPTKHIQNMVFPAVLVNHGIHRNSKNVGKNGMSDKMMLIYLRERIGKM